MKHPPRPESAGRQQTDNSTLDVAHRFRLVLAAGTVARVAEPELLPQRLVDAAARVLPVEGVGLSVFDADNFRVPLAASGADATRAERLQFTQGEGPCLEAAAARRTLGADAAEIERRWPAFAKELFEQTPYRSVGSIPTVIRASTLAVLDIYLTDPTAWTTPALGDALTVAANIAMMLATAPDTTTSTDPTSNDPAPAWLDAPDAEARQLVWFAIGMVMAKTGDQAADGLARLRAYAYSHNRTLDDLSALLVNGTIDVAELGA